MGKMESKLGWYKGKRVLITGHTGFKGTWLLSILEWAGADVTGISDSSNYRLYEQAKGSIRHNSLVCDIRDEEKVERAIKGINPDVIFHLAAQPLVIEGYRDFRRTWSTNVMGTLNVLEGIGCSANVVIATTDKVYKNTNNGFPFRESDGLGSADPYSASKAATELVVQSWRKRNMAMGVLKDVYVATARAGNVIGGGDYAKDRIIPDLVRDSLEKKTTRIRSPKAVRPWQHVLDALNGYLLLGIELETVSEKMSEGVSFNFGPTENDWICVDEIVERAKGYMEIRTVNESIDIPEAKLLMLDSGLARTELDWRCKWNVDQALKETFDWYKDVEIGGISPHDAMRGCIRRFWEYE